MILDNFRCVGCGSAKAEPFLSQCRDYYMGKPGSFDYCRCSDCGLVQLHPVPADMGVYYQAYQVHARKSWLHEAMRRLVMIGGYYLPSPEKEGLSLLDYGGGDGWYLREMSGRGHRAVGYEPNPDHARQLSADLGVPVFSDVSELEKDHAGSFDVVTMHFVVEHVSDLQETFRLAHRLLKPGGLFYFLIPNIESIEFKLFGRKWHGFDPPRHISFPTPPIIEGLAGKTAFEVENIRSFGMPNDVAGSLSNVVVGRYHYLAFCAFLPLALVWCRLFSQGCLAATLRKS